MKPATHQLATSAAPSPVQAPPYAQIATALRRMFLASGSKIGVDSLRHAVLAQALLKSAGFAAEVKVGYAAWRVGPGDGDVIVHAPGNDMAQQGKNAHPFHAWVEVGPVIFDATAYQFVVKATALDMIDGGKTDLQWAPLQLAEHRDQVQTLHTVLQADVGMFYYEHVPGLQAVIMAGVPPVDPEELDLLTIIFNHPSAQALSSNHVAAALLAA
ncbi:hypothetical protein [Duganella vulcania]|uniref:Uncharacterized protein n=1 Tax=Duganella vulcania TaxID=2692166 RepID=A0A845GDY2_9BURK|nr:hypothetical protein [Duganella vulcania]MYM92494.1 hypothetical protein [Duganella vulcania]